MSFKTCTNVTCHLWADWADTWTGVRSRRQDYPSSGLGEDRGGCHEAQMWLTWGLCNCTVQPCVGGEKFWKKNLFDCNGHGGGAGWGQGEVKRKK